MGPPLSPIGASLEVETAGTDPAHISSVDGDTQFTVCGWKPQHRRLPEAPTHRPLNTHLDLQHRAENEEHTQALKSWRLGFHRISKDGQSTWAELPVTADERQIEKPSEDVLNSHGPARSPDPTQEAHFSAGVTTPCVCLCVCTHSRSHSLAL